jgi:hypothetical protein
MTTPPRHQCLLFPSLKRKLEKIDASLADAQGPVSHREQKIPVSNPARV